MDAFISEVREKRSYDVVFVFLEGTEIVWLGRVGQSAEQ